jgi:hypothetical protein
MTGGQIRVPRKGERVGVNGRNEVLTYSKFLGLRGSCPLGRSAKGELLSFQ